MKRLSYLKKDFKCHHFLSENELAKYMRKFRYSGSNLCAYLFARKNSESPPGILPKLAYDHALMYKGFILSAASRLNSLALTSPTTEEINLRLKDYRRLLSEEYTKPIAERNGIAELEDKANQAEKNLPDQLQVMQKLSDKLSGRR